MQDNKNNYIIMEHAKGGELFNYITNKHRLSEQEASFFFYQIINGMEYLHKSNIVHRDLKPENLLLTEEKIIKIIDFGLSNEFSNKNYLLSTPCGSPCYAAPEMVIGKKYSGIKIDIWATGIILFAMVCGYLPFEDKKNEVLFKKIIDCDFEFPHYISHNVKDLIKKILVTNPCNRATIDDIKKHSFYKQGKIAFFKDQKYLLENIFDSENENNIEIEQSINERIIMEINNKLNKNFTINDIEKIKSNSKFKQQSKKINIEENHNNHVNNDKMKYDKDYRVDKYTYENDKDLFYEDVAEHNKNNICQSANLENKFFPNHSLKSSKNNFNSYSSYSVTYDILFNNILKDKIFLKNLFSKLSKESIENNAIDRESRRSNSITNNQVYFNQPKINLNFNCEKKFENVNFNIIPIVSISSVPYSSNITKNNSLEKTNLKNPNNLNINNKNNTIKNTNSLTNNNLNKLNNKENKEKNFSIYNSTPIDLNLNTNSKNNFNHNNTINNINSEDANINVVNKLSTNFLNTITDNNHTAYNKFVKYKTVMPNLTCKNDDNISPIEAKSMYSQFLKDTYNKNINLISTIKKINSNNNENKYKTINYAEDEKHKITKVKNYSVDNNNINFNMKSKQYRVVEDQNNNENVFDFNLKKKNLNSNINNNEKININQTNFTKKRNLSNKLSMSKNNDNWVSLLNNIFKKSTFNSNKLNPNLNINTIDENNPNKQFNLKLSSEKSKAENKKKKIDNQNYPNNKKYATISNNKINKIVSVSNKNTTRDTSYKKNSKSNDFNTINNKNNIKNLSNQNIEKFKLNIIDIQSNAPKSPKKPSEGLKVTDIKKINNFRDSNKNYSDKKNYYSNKKSIISTDRISYENTEDLKNLERKIFNNDPSKNYQLSINDSNKQPNNHERSQTEFFNFNFNFKDNKANKLKKILKDSLVSTSIGFDLSTIQKKSSQKKKTNKDIICFSSVNPNNNFKTTISSNYNNTINTNTTNITLNNVPQKTSGNNSSRILQIKNFQKANLKARPLSNNFEIRNIKSNLNEDARININQREYDNFYTKPTETLKYNSNTNTKNYMEIKRKENNNHAEVNEIIKKGKTLNNHANENINTIDVDLFGENKNQKKSKNKINENITKNNNKKIKDRLIQYQVSLDLFNSINVDNKNNINLKKTQNEVFNRKNLLNAFNGSTTKDKLLIEENKISNYSTNYTKNTNINFNNIKLNTKSNSISNGKITLSNKPTIKK